MGLWAVENNRAVRIKEYYYDGRKKGVQRTDEEYYSALEKLADGFDIQYVIIDPSAASFIATIRNHGKFSVRKARNDVLNGIRTTMNFLKNDRLFFCENCRDAVREFGLYRWNDKAGHEDTVIKENDHAMDDIRYFCYTILRRIFISEADGYYGIFPRGLENRFKVGDGCYVIEEDYIIFFRNGTPDEIKDRFIKEYAEYYAKKKMEQMTGIYND